MNYPYETSKATKWNWGIAYMAGHEIAYVGTQSGKEIIPRMVFKGTDENRVGASVDNIRDLAEAVQMVINHAAKATGKRKPSGGLAMNPFSEYHNEDNIAWDFAVFPRDKDRAKITVRVYTDDIHGGSCVILCPPLVMSDIPSMVQFKRALETSYQWGMSQSKKYTRLNLPPENDHARPD
jgi:hypothetical protein